MIWNLLETIFATLIMRHLLELKSLRRTDKLLLATRTTTEHCTHCAQDTRQPNDYEYIRFYS